MKSIELKVKIKHLAAEAKIIREESRKVHGMEKWSLNYHRTQVVRPAARATQLAYAFMRGKPYHVIEQRRKPEKWTDFEMAKKEAKRMIRKYSDIANSDEAFDKWVEEASPIEKAA